ncbi:MAG: UvrD-helicase domain-containing protein [Lentisphaerae bacterium]|nr:UvrD-helicase domain-containing protein [Lentisphaerota bacterium]
MKTTGHKAILASAGSGKTFQLAHRYIRLLAEDDSITPDRICAMTFTRKAAGEIFDSIAKYLGDAAANEESARITADKRIHMPHLKQKHFLQILRRFIDGMHRARIGTLDSFIVGIVKAFPLELGIPMNFNVVESGTALAKDLQQMVLNQMLNPGGQNKSQSDKFLQAFRNATYGHEEKNFGKILDDFVNEMRRYYQLCPNKQKWGNEDIIWPGTGRPWKFHKNHNPSLATRTVVEWADTSSQYAKDDRNLYTIIKQIALVLAEYGSTSSWDDAMKGPVFERLLDHIDELGRRDTAIPYNRKDYTIPAEVGKAMLRLMHSFLAVEYDRILRRTQGLYDLLETYENTYKEMCKNFGVFSFTDLQYLLAGDGTSQHQVLSRLQNQEGRLYIDYRMDCRLDHWLLDEFQDTSDLQWAVFNNLVAEIIQSQPSDRRSFFYVGDIKQSIYRWRGGNHELFHDLLQKYGNEIEIESLNLTQRCATPVVNTLNAVFGSLPEDLPPGVVSKWNTVWHNHETAAQTRIGYTALLEANNANSDEETNRYYLVADILNHLQPVRRNIEVGILVRQNNVGRMLVNVLRQKCPGMNFVHEGEAAITDNEIAQVITSLVKIAAHPGNNFAWKYIQMSPIADVLHNMGISFANLPLLLLTEITTDGFLAFVKKWRRRLTEQIDIGLYGEECAIRLETAAAEFDQTGSRDCNGFIKFLADYTIREQPSSSSVRVMTIHQSKGLEFDVVILPDLQSRSGGNMIKARSPDIVYAGRAANPTWILRMPKTVLAKHDPVLDAELIRINEEHCFDSLCLLYVAMTRAKYGLYMVISPDAKSSKTIYMSSLLKNQLCGDSKAEPIDSILIADKEHTLLYESDKNMRDWHKHKRKQEASESSPEPKLPADYGARHERSPVIRYRKPSEETEHLKSASMLFQIRSRQITDFGLAIHELFEAVEWSDNVDTEGIVKNWLVSAPSYDPDVIRDVVAQFRNCMKAEPVIQALSRPDGHALLWREKQFEIMLNGSLLSGAFDRVTISIDASKRYTQAFILDYKSSVVESEAAINRKANDYKPQMEAYRTALAHILKIPESSVTTKLLFTRKAVVRNIPF